MSQTKFSILPPLPMQRPNSATAGGAAVAYAQAEHALHDVVRRLEIALESATLPDGASAQSKSSLSQSNKSTVEGAITQAAWALNKLDAAIEAAKVAAEEDDLPQTMREYLGKLHILKNKAQEERRKLAQVRRAGVLAQEQRRNEERTALLARSSASASVDIGGANNTRRQMLEQASLLDVSKDVTASLRRTRDMVMREVQRLTETEKVIESDAQKIQSTYQEYDSYSSAAGRSDAALKELQHQERLDKIAIASGFSCFLLVVLYIVWKRTIGWFWPF